MTLQLKQKLAAGEPAVVLNADHPSASLVEFLATLPIDALFIDCEQGSADVESVENMIRAARLADLPAIVRLFSGEDWVIERYMGRGADGIVVPRLEAPAEAAAAVAAVRYCYPHDFQKKLVVVQIETRKALEALTEFLAVDGVDVYFLGPVDLAKSLGFKGDYRHPQMQRILEDAIGQIRNAGKVAGILVDRQTVGGYVALGAQFLYDHANSFLRQGAIDFRSVVDRCRSDRASAANAAAAEAANRRS